MRLSHDTNASDALIHISVRGEAGLCAHRCAAQEYGILLPAHPKKHAHCSPTPSHLRLVLLSCKAQSRGLHTFVHAAKGALADEALELKAAKFSAALLQQLWQDEEGRLKPHQVAGMARHPCGGAGSF